MSSPGYAPESASISMLIAKSVPSRFAPILTVALRARPCVIAVRLSDRDSIHRIGRPSRRANAETTTCSGEQSIFAPNPPPTVCAITRTSSTGRPSEVATISRIEKTSWMDAHTVSPFSSGAAVHAFTSSGTGARICATTLCSITTWASWKKAGSSPVSNSIATLVPASGNRWGASAMAAWAGSTTAGRGSMSATTTSAASNAWARVSATTTASGSPTNRTTSRARIGRANASGSAPDVHIGFRSRSREVKTPTIPGMAAASSTSTPSNLPCARKDRTNTAWAAPDEGTSSV